jgi:GT2 family glycosyltransferase
MDFTFGIITDGKNDNFIIDIISSIINNKIPNYEIIIVGNTKIVNSENIKIFLFDETVKRGWITRKKNIIIENAKYENLVLMHDYVKLDENWYNGFIEFGNDFEFCVNKIFNKDGRRFRDYTLMPLYFVGISDYFVNNCLLPYDFENTNQTNHFLYISGAYFVIKRDIAQKNKLDEKLCHCYGEDVELCQRLNEKNIIIKCNKYSAVHFLKYKEQQHWEREVNENELSNFVNKYSINPVWKFDSNQQKWIK